MIDRITEALSKVKRSIGNNERHVLPDAIDDGLLWLGELPLYLFIYIISTAATVVITARHTWLLTTQRERLIPERDVLDTEWCNLVFEESAFGNHSCIERVATERLQMQHVDPS